MNIISIFVNCKKIEHSFNNIGENYEITSYHRF